MKSLKAFSVSLSLLAAVFAASAARADFLDLWVNKSASESGALKAPALGHSRILVIPVQVNAAPSDLHPPLNMPRLRQFFTEDDSLTFGFRSYLRAASLGRFEAEADVMEPIVFDGCPTSLAQTGCSIGASDVSALPTGIEFVREIFRIAHDERHVNFLRYDVNGLDGGPDGYADGVILIVNTPKVGLAFPIFLLNGAGSGDLAGGHGGAFMFDGVKIPTVAVAGIRAANNMPSAEYVATHEFGKLLGLADLSYAHPAGNDPAPKYAGLHFSVMGDWGYDNSAVLPDAESRRVLGWTNTHVVSGSETIRLKPIAAGGQVLKLGMMRTGGHLEYFLAEARGAHSQLDKLMNADGLPTAGLAVYHVDWSRGPKPNAGTFVERVLHCLACDPFRPFIQNLEPDGRFTFITGGLTSDDQLLFREGAAVLPSFGAPAFDSTHLEFNTNYYDGTESGISISNVHVDDVTGDVTATFGAPLVLDACSDMRGANSPIACGPGLTCEAGSCLRPTDLSGIGTGLNGQLARTAAIPSSQSGGCASTSASSLALLAPLALFLRRRRS